MHRRLVLVCLGLLFLLAACSNASTGQSTNQVTSSQASSNSTRAKTTDQTSSAGLPHATPTHNSSGVTASSSAGSSASTSASSSGSSSTPSGQTASLVLTLACSGPKAQDGFHMSGSQARACVYTSPGAHLNIQVSFCGNKLDTSDALQGTFTANGSGFYAWNWKPQVSCQSLSAWSATVTAQLNGQSAVVSEGSSAQTSSQSTSQSTSKGSAHSSSSSSSSVNVPDGW